MKNWLEQIIYDKNPLAEEILIGDFCKNIFQDHLNKGDFSRLLGAIISIRGFAYALKRARSRVTAQKKPPIEIKE